MKYIEREMGYDVGDTVVDLTAKENGWPDDEGVVTKIDGSNVKVRYHSGTERWKLCTNLRHFLDISSVGTETMQWNDKTRILSEWISNIGKWAPFYRLRSHQTGKQVEVILNHEERDIKGHLLWCDYKLFNEDSEFNFTFRVYNN